MKLQIINWAVFLLTLPFLGSCGTTAADWNYLSNSMDQGFGQSRSYSSQPRRFCYYDEYGSSPTCFSSVVECRQSIQVNHGGTCVAE